jgi:GTP-binding protein
MPRFIDFITILVRAGDGGSGCASSYQDQLTARVFLDGGSGGKGGDVYLIGDGHINTLISLSYEDLLRAGNGEHGSYNNCTGATGDDLCIKVPLGTVATINGNSYEIMDSDPIKILSGGAGGRGSSLLKYKRKDDGVKSEPFPLTLQVKTIGDIGLIGLPNAGKSSLLNGITNAHVQVGSYAFTTTKPQLGVWKDIIFVDLPGLIEHASEGKGMGLRFLSHIERCKILLAIIDINDPDPTHTYKILLNEIQSYGITAPLNGIVLTKIETCKSEYYRFVMQRFKALGLAVYPLSVHKKIRVNKFLYAMLKKVKNQQTTTE